MAAMALRLAAAAGSRAEQRKQCASGRADKGVNANWACRY